jgi:hypothetical protein
MVDLTRNFSQFSHSNSMAIQTAEFGPLNSKWAIPSPNSYIQTGTKAHVDQVVVPHCCNPACRGFFPCTACGFLLPNFVCTFWGPVWNMRISLNVMWKLNWVHLVKSLCTLHMSFEDPAGARWRAHTWLQEELSHCPSCSEMAHVTNMQTKQGQGCWFK